MSGRNRRLEKRKERRKTVQLNFVSRIIDYRLKIAEQVAEVVDPYGYIICPSNS